jgi:hypothetical protein
MTWTKTGDEFADECWELSDAAYRLHHEGLTWSNRKATDGKLAKDDMVRWAKRPGAAEELVACGWWEDRGEYFQIVHHLGYQRTKDEVAHQANVNRENAKKRWAAAQARAAAKAAKEAAENDSLCESQSESQCERARTGQARTGTGAAPKKKEAQPADRNGQPMCLRCGGWVAAGDTAGPGGNPYWCRDCNDTARADMAGEP